MRRISPANVTSPIATMSMGVLISATDEKSDKATARSVAGSRVFMPPMVDKKTSLWLRVPSPCLSRTACSEIERGVSRPLTTLRGTGRGLPTTSDWISMGRGRFPSNRMLVATPAMGVSRCPNSSPDGSGTSCIPCSVCSKHPISSAGP